MRRSVAIVIALLLLALPAAAQSFEMGGRVGFTPSASLDRHAPQLEGTSIDSGLTFGIAASSFLSKHWGVEAEWGQQFSGFSFEPRESGSATEVRLYDINISHLHGYAVYRFGDAAARWQPFVVGGGGMSFFSAHDLETESKLSLGIGGGLLYAVSRSIGIEARGVYRLTMMNDSEAADFCDAFGYCQSTLQQFDFMGGVRFRF